MQAECRGVRKPAPLRGQVDRGGEACSLRCGLEVATRGGAGITSTTTKISAAPAASEVSTAAKITTAGRPKVGAGGAATAVKVTTGAGSGSIDRRKGGAGVWVYARTATAAAPAGKPVVAGAAEYTPKDAAEQTPTHATAAPIALTVATLIARAALIARRRGIPAATESPGSADDGANDHENEQKAADKTNESHDWKSSDAAAAPARKAVASRECRGDRRAITGLATAAQILIHPIVDELRSRRAHDQIPLHGGH